jgi:Flp pilus assembly protein TadD
MGRASRKTSSPARTVVVPPPVSAKPAKPGWIFPALLFAGAVILAFILYAPSLNGDFVFDDRTLPFFYKDAATLPFRAWLGTRPLLMASYYLNYHANALDPFAYHAVNVLMHAICSVLIFYAVRRILEWAGTPARERFGAAFFAAGLFLVHPIQTEAVSYIASRSETLSVLFFLAAFNVFLYRGKQAVTARVAAAILLLYFAAITSKEHTAVLPAVLLLTDFYWNPGFRFDGIRRNWKLYVPICIGGVLGVAYILSRIGKGSNAGFSFEGFTWYQYLFTEFRAFFVYVRLLIAPFGQSADYDFPVSHTLFQHGAIIYGIALIALAVLAFIYRKRFPVASYGFFLTLILLAPTSSFIPIRDPLAERRLYLPFIGIVLIVAEWTRRARWRQSEWLGACGILLVFAAFSYQRNCVWVDMQSLWADAYAQNPRNVRAAMGLADGYVMKGQCAEALPYFQKAAGLQRDYQNVYNLASVYDCLNQAAPAMAAYQGALQIQQKSEAWVHIGILDLKTGKFDDAAQAFDRAEQIDGSYLNTFIYRGIMYLAQSRFDDAAVQFKTVLGVEPANQLALRGMERASAHVRQF